MMRSFTTITIATMAVLVASTTAFSQQTPSSLTTGSEAARAKVHKIRASGPAKSEAVTPTKASQPRISRLTGDESASAAKVHRVVIQVTQNDPAVMTVALNNADNLTNFYRQKGESVQVELVAYGPGLHMMRSDTSPVRERLKSFAENNKQLIFSGCGNTLNAQSKQEGKELTLLPEARVVPTGVGRITELQEQGWTYIRP